MVGFYVAVKSGLSLQPGGYGLVEQVWRHKLVYCHFLGHTATPPNFQSARWADQRKGTCRPGNYAFAPSCLIDLTLALCLKILWQHEWTFLRCTRVVAKLQSTVNIRIDSHYPARGRIRYNIVLVIILRLVFY